MAVTEVSGSCNGQELLVARMNKLTDQYHRYPRLINAKGQELLYCEQRKTVKEYPWVANVRLSFRKRLLLLTAAGSSDPEAMKNDASCDANGSLWEGLL